MRERSKKKKWATWCRFGVRRQIHPSSRVPKGAAEATATIHKILNTSFCILRTETADGRIGSSRMNKIVLRPPENSQTGLSPPAPALLSSPKAHHSINKALFPMLNVVSRLNSCCRRRFDFPLLYVNNGPKTSFLVLNKEF
jgi:hypothetical protein